MYINTLFCGRALIPPQQELYAASASRLDSLDSIREEVLEDVEDFREELEEFESMKDELGDTPGTPRNSLGRDSLGGDSVEDYAGQLQEALVKRDHVHLQLMVRTQGSKFVFNCSYITYGITFVYNYLLAT